MIRKILDAITGVPEREASGLQMRLLLLQLDHEALKEKWNALVATINARGGKAFLDGNARVLNGDAPPQFTKQEIRMLLLLCHPDKHNGHPSAHEMTLKLLELKGQ